MQTSIFKNTKWVLILATVCCFLWGSAFPSLKVGYEMLQLGSKPYTYKILFAGYRFFIASLMILSYGIFNGLIPKLSMKQFAHLTFIGMLQTTIGYILFYIGLANTTGVKGSILTGTGTFFSIILAHFYYHDDKLSINKVLGLLFGFIGVVTVSLSKGNLDFGFRFIGEGFLMLSALAIASAGLYAKELSRQISPVAVSGVQMLIGALLLIGFSGSRIGVTAIHFEGRSILLLLYLAFISAMAFTLWFTLIKYHKIGKISIYKFQIPIWGTILSALVLPGESITIAALFALGLVVIGIILVNLENPVLKIPSFKEGKNTPT